MPWMPGVIRKEVARHGTGMAARRFVFHTAVSSASSLFAYFSQPGNATSHFYVTTGGTIEQYVNTNYQAPAQLEGNHDCLSVETQDMGAGFPTWSGSDVPAWRAPQVTALARIAAWAASIHQIPLLMLPDSRNGQTGYGYHRLGVDPWRVAGGERWSTSYGKVCPGDRRIAQVPTIIARAKQIIGGDWFDMATEADLERIIQGQLNRALDTLLTGKPNTSNPPNSSAAVDNMGLHGFLYRMANVLRNGQPNATWPPGSSAAVDNVGLDGVIAASAVDPATLAAELAPLIVAGLPDPTELTQQQIQDACEAATRKVLGGLDNTPA